MKPPRGPSAMQWQGDEHNAIHLGYSRDSFHFHRPSPVEGAGPTPLNTSADSGRLQSSVSAEWRTPFIDEHERPGDVGWTYGNVQSVGGGFVVLQDELRFFFSARSGTSDLNCTTGVATLRRDGFASVHPSSGLSSGWMLTRPMRYLPDNPPWDPLGLWLNVDASASGASVTIKLLKLGESVAHSAPILNTNATKTPVKWLDGDAMGAISGGAPFQLKFYLDGPAQLFSFWVSSDECGTSGGFMAAGGPGFAMGRDCVCSAEA